MREKSVLKHDTFVVNVWCGLEVFFQKSHFSLLNFIFLVRCLQSTKKWFRARTAFGLTIHHPAQNKNEIHLQKKRTPEKGAQVLPFGNRFQGVILLNKSSTSAWLEIILLANINKYFRYSTLYFFFEIRKPFESKNLYGRVERRWISIFETMGIHLRLARPIEDGPANRRPPRSFKRRANTQDRPTFSVGDVFWVACRNCGTKSASCTKTVFFFKRNYAHFFTKYI